MKLYQRATIIGFALILIAIAILLGAIAYPEGTLFRGTDTSGIGPAIPMTLGFILILLSAAFLGHE